VEAASELPPPEASACRQALVQSDVHARQLATGLRGQQARRPQYQVLLRHQVPGHRALAMQVDVAVLAQGEMQRVTVIQ
jgi:hypothetical protein